MNAYEIRLPSKVVAGQGSTEKLREFVRQRQCKRALLFTDKGVMAAGLCQDVLRILKSEKVACFTIDSLKAEPTAADVQKAIDEAAGQGGDLIIAVGGGSVMDGAKLASLCLGADYGITELLSKPELARKRVATVMLPTTCGTGSEATCNAIVAIPLEETKKGIVSAEMIADYVILDPNMILSLPPAILAATAVDALAHGVECFTSKKATAFSDVFALEAVRLIMENIERAYRKPKDIQAKERMMLGAFYGGAAISGSGTTAVHALAYPLGGRYHIPHGVSNAMLLAHVMDFNRKGCEGRLARLWNGVYPQHSGLAVEEKARLFIDRIGEIIQAVEIPQDLKAFGVMPEHMDFLVKGAREQKRLLVNNCVELEDEDIRSIYGRVLSDERR